MFGSEPTASEGGIAVSIRRLLESSVEFLKTKFDLISVELQEEKRRVLELLMLAATAMLFGVLALTTITFTVVVVLWDTPYRETSLLVISLFYVVVTIILFVRLRRKASLTTKVFETTVEELKKDTEWIRRHL